jgi:hypothetical protein
MDCIASWWAIILLWWASNFTIIISWVTFISARMSSVSVCIFPRSFHFCQHSFQEFHVIYF